MKPKRPKITYRSDTTGHLYHMIQMDLSSFIIVVTDFQGTQSVDISKKYMHQSTWIDTVHDFFDIITVHINHDKWEE